MSAVASIYTALTEMLLITKDSNIVVGNILLGFILW